MKQQRIMIFLLVGFLAASCARKSEETTPVRKDVTEMVFASGILEANNTYNLTAQADGYLMKLNFQEGDLIEAGTVLAVIDNRESVFNTESASALYQIAERNTNNFAPAIAQAKNTLQLTKQKAEFDSLQYLRYKTLHEKNSVSKTEYENYFLQFTTSKSNYESASESYKLVKQQAEQELISSKASKNINATLSANNQIKAMVSGRVYKKMKQTGDFVRRGDAIATIGDANFIYAKVNIDESNINKVKVGQEAVIQLNIDKDKVYKGTVAEIYPTFDDASQSFLCKIIFTDSLHFKIVGTQLQSNIIIGKQMGALLIPRNFLDFDGTVTLKKDKSKVYIKTNFISKDWVQITSGIDEKTLLTTENIASNKMTTSELGSQMR